MSNLSFLVEILCVPYHAVCSRYRVKRDFCDARSRRGEGLQRAELAQRTGCNLETVRYYEKVGLLLNRRARLAGYRS